MKSIRSFPIVLAVTALILSACGPVPATPTVLPAPEISPTAGSTTTETASPTKPTAAATLTAGQAAIEKAWVIQKPLIDSAIASVFNDKVTSPWLRPVLDITTLLPGSPAAHCQAMKLWDNFIPVPGSLPGCKADHNPLKDYFGITTAPLETGKNDNLVLKVFFYRPLSFCDAEKCILLPVAGGAYYGMPVGNYYQVVTICKKPTGTPTLGSLYQLLPYLNDPVSMFIKYDDTYIEIIANRGAWFSFGWESGKGWDNVFRVCPNP